jgi:protein-S-isoprenylcysteine O-methyltransferase Ste14
MTLQAFIFKNRGLLLSLPAAMLVGFGRPSRKSIAAGVPLAVAGELLRCWAVGYSGVTTRNDVVTAPRLVTAGPYAYLRNPLYLGNFITAAGFAFAFTGKNRSRARRALVLGSLGVMAAVYAAIIPHEEEFLRERFGEEFDSYCARVPRIVPQLVAHPHGEGQWQADAVLSAETKTFALFGAMLAALTTRARRS